MTSDRDDRRAILQTLLEEHGLGTDTRLYREASADALVPTDTLGVFRLRANPSPTESVIDVYGQGYLVQAEEVGPGLAFAESSRPHWQETVEFRALRADRSEPAALPPVEVEVRLLDILDQGGLLYPVESVTVERVWYCTLPADGIEVRAAT